MPAAGFEPYRAVRLSPLVQRLTSNNPGTMTGPGTNTYVLGESNCVVIDPGPLDELHIQAVLDAANHSIAAVCVTHTHPDHSPSAARLSTLTGARLVGLRIENDGHQDDSFIPAVPLRNGDQLAGEGFTLEAIYTPGHVSNHFCYLLREEGMLFTGDHIMQGSTVVIIPPGGDMAEYMDSLALLKSLDLSVLAPGHGDLIRDPLVHIEGLLAHRLQRERKVISSLQSLGECSLSQLTKQVYDDVDEHLHLIASVSLWAHLLKLEREGRAEKTATVPGSLGEDRWKSSVS